MPRIMVLLKIKKIIELVEKRKYFTINRPRQYGKTTTMYLLEKELKELGYLVIDTSLEGIGSESYKDIKSFVKVFIELLEDK